MDEEWKKHVAKEKEKDLQNLILEEKLKESETRKFMENSFRDGEIKTAGTDIDELMPPMSRFGNSGRETKKKNLIMKFNKFFEKYYGAV